MLHFDDSYWTVIFRNRQREQGKWGRFSFLLGWEGADTRTSGRFYMEVVQCVLIFGSESWVRMPRIL